MKRFALCLAVYALSACGDDASDSSTLTLKIESDLVVPGEIDLVTVRASGQDAERDPAADLLVHPLPRTLTLVHESGPLGPFPVTVSGYLGGDLIVRRDLSVSFPARGDKQLTVELDRACKRITCIASETCDDGKCVPIGQDAGVADAGRDSGRDAGVDATSPPQDARVEDATQEEDSSTPPVEDAGKLDPGLPPTCTIALPVTGDAYQTGAAFPLQGACNDPETGALTALTWSSSLDGALGTGISISGTLTNAGAHRVSVCAADPRDAALTGCASTDITATITPQPAVTITSVAQNATTSSPYRNNAPIAFAGTASGAGVTTSWRDDLQGTLGTGVNASLAAPFLGRHTISFTVTDRNGVQQVATRSYSVLAPGELTLFSVLPNVNAELDRVGDLPVSSIISDPLSRAYVPSSTGTWYRFDGGAANASALPAVCKPPLNDVVQDAQIVNNQTYLATRNGLTVCPYSPQNGAGDPPAMGCPASGPIIGGGMGRPSQCTTYRAGGLLQSQNFLSVLRLVDSRNVDTLMVGSDMGLFISESTNGGTRGTSVLPLRVINDMVALGGQAALALDNGLMLLTPSTQAQVRFGVDQGLPSNTLRSLASAADNTLWIATAAGLAHFEPGTNRITSWNTTRGLPSNSCNGVAVQRVSEVGHDVIWVATSAGVARLDPTSNVMTAFTTADGLPSNNVLSVHVLANGIKLFGTQNGLARYTGF